MSIYKPVSTITRRAVGIGGSILGSLGNPLQGNLGNTLLGKTSNNLVQAGINIATTELTHRLSNPLMRATQKLDDRISHITRKGLKVFGLNAFNNEALADDALANAGGLSIRQIWENHKHTNPDQLSRKNFYVLEINDRTHSAPTSNGHRHSAFNLLCTNLSFSSFDIQSESVAVGAVELYKPNANARTTLNLTVFDDQTGTIKRWAENKANLIASSDGTFMPPAYYTFEVRIVFGTNIADKRYYEQIYSMCVQTMPHELSRTEQGLEEIQLVLAQTDTFMPHWI